MIHAAAILGRIALFVVGAVITSAEVPATADDLSADGILDVASNQELIEAIIAIAPSAPSPEFDEPMTDLPGSADGDWADVAEAGLGYPVTPSISVGLTYHLEEIEDLTAELIEMGTVGVDYTSHKVLVRANVALDFIP